MRRLIRTSEEPLSRRMAPLAAQGGALLLTALVVLALSIPLAASKPAEATPPPPPTELTQFRTASSRTFDNHDGTYTTSAYSGPIHYRDNQGSFQPISSALIASGETGYTYENEANSFRALFRPQAGADYLALESWGGRRFRLRLEDAASSSAQTRTRGLTYPAVFPGVDLRYELQPDGVKETLMLANAQVPTAYRFLLSPPDGAHIHAVAQSDGSWALYMAPHARPALVLEAPWLSERGDPAPAAPHATLDLTRVGSDFQLDLSLDGAWLRDPQRQFPVRVDPSIMIQPPTQDASFDFACSTCLGTASDRLPIGKSNISPSPTWRSALQFSLADIPAGASVSSARLKLYFDGTCVPITGVACGGTSHQVDVLRMLGSWSKSSKTSQLTFTDPLTPLASFTLPSGAAAQWMNWDITPTVQNWASGLTSNFGLLLKHANEPTTLSGPKPPSRGYAPEPTLGPKLEVTYNGDGGQLLEPETLHSSGAELQWIPYSGPGAPPFTSYEVHRSTSQSFTPSGTTRLTTIKDAAVTTYRDTTAKAGTTFTYKVLSSGVETNRQTVTLPADGQAQKLLRPDPAAGHDTYLTNRTDLVDCTNRGGLDRLKVGTDVNSIFRPLLRFEVGDLPVDTAVSGATLSLWHPDTTVSAQTVNAHRLTSPWQEGTGKDTCTGDGATWYEGDGGVGWARNGGDFDSTVAASLAVPVGQAAGWHAFTVTSLVQGWARGDFANDGLLLKAADETIVAGKFIDYYASDFSVAPTLRPKLAIAYTDGSHAAGPIVSLRKPAAGEQVSGSAVTVSASAVDDRRVDSVQFFRDGTVSLGTDTSEPFSVTWSSTGITNGSHSLTARATDDAGNQTTSAAVAVTVGNSAPPTTSITSPGGGATVSGTVTVNANASDDLGVTKVEFLADGFLVASDASAPYSASWNTLASALPAYEGTHTLTAKAYDAQGQVTTSAGVAVTVANAAGTKYLADISSTAFPPEVRYDPAAPSERSGIDVTVVNRSTVTWAAGDVVLRYRWLGSDGVVTDSGNLSLGTGPLLPNGSALVHVLADPPNPGTSRADYQLRFDLYDVPSATWFAGRGNKPLQQSVGVRTVSEEEKLGLEPYYQYEPLELGGGMQQMTNVATGNSLLRWVPFQSPGRGLPTEVELTYNSRERCRGPQSQCLAGNGWSFGVSSVLRFGSTIDEHPNGADQLANRPERRVEVIDSDGTKHIYYSSDGTHWTRPDGFHLYLRKVGGNWLLTRPDRTTYAYNGSGFPLYVEDKNLNRITFVADNPNAPQRVVRVDDAGGRSFWISYYNLRNPHVDGRLQTITDHTGHVLEFQYYDDGNLLRLTQHGGADGDRSFVFNYAREGSGTDPAIASRQNRFNPDPGTANQSDRIYSVQDPRTIAAQAGNETVFGYNNPHGGGQDWQLITSCDRENNSTVTSPCLRANATTTFTYADHASPCQAGTCTVVAKPLGRSTTYWYASDGLVTKIIDPLNRETDQTWLARHLNKVIDQPTGLYVEYRYNANGLITDEFDQLLQNINRYTYYDLAADGNDVTSSISVLHTRADAGGNTWTYNYDAPKINLLQVDDPIHTTTDYTYYADGTLHTVEDANHHLNHFQRVYENYDPNGFAQRVTDAKGQVTKAAYDADGLKLWAQDANHTDESYSDQRWFRTVFDYDNFHELVRQSEPKSTHLQAGMLIWKETDYNANGNVITERGPAYRPATDSSVPVTTTEYDHMDRQTKITAPDIDHVTTFQYDAAGRLERTTLPLGVKSTDKANDYVTKNVYDGLDRIVTEIGYNAETQDGLPARKTHYCYDGVGDLRWVIAPMAHLDNAPTGCVTGGAAPSYTTRYTYDAAHRQLTEMDPLHTSAGKTRTRTTVYYSQGSSRGKVQYEYAEDGTRTEYTYTARGELETTIQTYMKDGLNNPTRTLISKTVYDPVGNIVCEVSPRAWDYGSRCNPNDPGGEGYYTTHYTYDAVNQLQKISLPTDGNQDPDCPRTYVHRTYDANGNMTLMTLPDCATDLANVPENKKTTIDNDDPGWIASSNDHVNPAIGYDYQAQGLQTLRQTGHRWGKVMRWQYSLGGNLLLTSDRQSVPSTFEYDLNDNEITAERQVAGHEGDPVRFDIHSFYNGFDEQTKVRQFLSTDNWRSTKYEYNDNGELMTRRDDGREHDNGDEIAPWHVHTFAYDEAGQLEVHEDLGTDPGEDAGDEKITLTYKPTGWEETRLLERMNNSGGWDAKLFTARAYFPSGDLMSLATYRGGSPNPQLLLEQHTLDYITDGIYLNGNRVSDTFKLVGPLGQANCRTDSCTTSYQYGPRENLTRETRTRGGSTESTRYHLDSAMNVTDEYLTPAIGGEVHTRQYQYDGNRLAHLHVYTPSSTPDRYFRYEDGNLRCVTTSDVACPAAPLTMTPDATLLEDYRWNGRDRISSFRRFVQNPSTANYSYDPLDRVATQTDSRGQTTYSYLGTSDNVSSETLTAQGSPPSTRSYSYGPDDERNGMATSSHDYYYTRNVHADVSLLIGANDSEATASYVYKPYGGPDPLSIGDPEGPDLTNPYRFNDNRFDPGSTTLDMGTRRYNSDLNRFVQRDSYENADEDLSLGTDDASQNRYGFAAGNPVFRIEIDGHVATRPRAGDFRFSSTGSSTCPAGVFKCSLRFSVFFPDERLTPYPFRIGLSVDTYRRGRIYDINWFMNWDTTALQDDMTVKGALRFKMSDNRWRVICTHFMSQPPCTNEWNLPGGNSEENQWPGHPAFGGQGRYFYHAKTAKLHMTHFQYVFAVENEGRPNGIKGKELGYFADKTVFFKAITCKLPASGRGKCRKDSP